jgi:SpoVK/Ycf46/Vps4 family AAA+-type ATPase
MEIAQECVGYVPADLAALIRKAELLHSRDTIEGSKVLNSEQNQQQSTFLGYVRQAMSLVGASALRDAAIKTPPKITWDDIAGDPGGAKTTLRQAIEWPRTRRAAYLALNLSPPRGILLYGPPGCAKTTLARAAAGAMGVSFMSLEPADVYASSYVGDAESIIRRAFSLARSAAPCILFFDEIDSILSTNNSDNGGGEGHGLSRGTSSSAEARVLSTFLNEMDGVDGSWKDGVLVLGATNRPWTIDAALLRPGRFDKIIYVPPPDYEGRKSILSLQCQNWNLSNDNNIDIDLLASDLYSKNMTGAEIVGACHEAAMIAFHEAINNQQKPQVQQQHLMDALRNVHPLLSNEAVLNQFTSFEEKRKRS